MALHKIVNGKKIDLTPEEEASLLAEWEENRIKEEEARVAHLLKKQEEEKALDKLLANLSPEEKKLLKSKFLK